MTEVHATPMPEARLRGSIEHPALRALDLEQLQRLRNTSQWLYVLGLLWGLGGLVAAYLGMTMINAQGDDASLGLWLMAYGLVVAVIGPFSAWARPGWGRFACMLLSLPPVLKFPYGTVTGIIHVLTLGAGWPLFGENKVSDTELAAAIQARGR